MPFTRNTETGYTQEQKTAYRVFYFCLGIVMVGTVVLISSLAYSESNVVKEIIGVILVISGASLCYFVCVQIRKPSVQVPKPQDSQSCSNQIVTIDQDGRMAYLIVDSSGKLILHPLSSDLPLTQRPTGEPPLLIMSSQTADAGTVNFQNLASCNDSVSVPWPLSMNRRRQLAQMALHTRESGQISSSTTHETTDSLSAEPPQYFEAGTTTILSQPANASTNLAQPSEPPPPYEVVVGQASSSRS